MNQSNQEGYNYYQELSKIIGTSNAKNEFLKALKKYSTSEYSSTELSHEKSNIEKNKENNDDIIEISVQEKDTDKKIINLDEEEEEFDIEINNSKSEDENEDVTKKKIQKENQKISHVENTEYISKKRTNSNTLNINTYEPVKKIEEKDKDESMYLTPGFSLLLKLVNEFGIDNILSCLCKEKFDKNKKLDSFLEGLLESCGGVKLIFMILKLQFSKLTFNNNLNLKNNLQPIYSDNEIAKIKEENAKMLMIQKENQKMASLDIYNNKKKEKNNNTYKKELGLGLHYHKDLKGDVYKFRNHHFQGNNICIFYCCDKKCKASAKYNTDTMEFKMDYEHTIQLNEHNYMTGAETENDRKMFKNLRERNDCTDVQIFRRPNGKEIKWY